jgi:hypothetical protein
MIFQWLLTLPKIFYGDARHLYFWDLGAGKDWVKQKSGLKPKLQMAIK